MGLFSRQRPASDPAARTSTATVPVADPSPGINLAKGQGITLRKTPLVTATISWPPTTDYDVFALVRYRDGSVQTVSTFGTKADPRGFSLATTDGTVRHLGDVKRGRGKLATEVVEVRLVPDVLAVVPVAYSAQSNGTGSFHQYQVSMSIDNGAGDSVVVHASNASRDASVYSCVPGIILNQPDGLRIEALELYSAPGSEHRPEIGPDLTVRMDAGPLNAYK
jgi:stress response protein SCP2